MTKPAAIILGASQTSPRMLKPVEFLSGCERVLEFEFKQDAPGLDTLDTLGDYDFDDLIVRAFNDRFWDEIWVSRGEYVDLLDLLRSKKHVVLHGPRGCGKSTLLQRVIQDRAAGNLDFTTPSLVYIDLDTVLFNDGEESANRDLNIVLHRQLELSLASESSKDLDDLSTQDRWLLYQYRFCASFEAMRLHVRLPLNSPNKALSIAINSPNRDALLQRAISQFSNQSVEDKRDDLLTFLTDSRFEGQRILILIDNVDSKKPNQQLEVYHSYQRMLARFWTSTFTIMAARTTTFMRFNEENGTDKRSTPLKISTEKETLVSIVRARIDLLDQIVRTSVMIGSPTYSKSSVAQAIKINVDQQRLFDSFGDALTREFATYLTRVIDHLGGDDFYELIVRWNNHSIRSASQQLWKLLMDLTLGIDPAGVYIDPISTASIRRKAVATSMAYRYMVFGEEDGTSTPELLEVTRPANRSAGKPMFLAMHILEFLYTRQSDDLTWGHLCALGHAYGLKPSDVWSGIRSLQCWRGFEAEGLVAIYPAKNRAGPRMPKNSEVEIRPAGLLFVEDLSTSLEYLCWAGMWSRRVDTVLLAESVGDLSNLRMHRSRITAATRYVSEVLLRGWEREIPELQARSEKDSRSALLEEEIVIDDWYGGFGAFTFEWHGGLSYHYAARAATTVADQADKHSDLDQATLDTLEQIRTQVSDLTKAVEDY